jgi:hypothetical protein
VGTGLNYSPGRSFKEDLMKRILLIGIMILTLTAGHGYAQMGGGMMGPGMMRGMRQSLNRI